MMLNKVRLILSGTLRRQLIWGVVGVHALMMSLFVWDLTIRQQEMLQDQQTSLATGLARSIATSTALSVVSRDLAGLQEVVVAQQSHANLVYAMILNQQGQILAHTDRQFLGKYVLDLPLQPALQVLRYSPTQVDVFSPLTVAERHAGWVRVGFGESTTHTQLERIVWDGILYALAAIVIGALLASFMAARLTRRLDRIQAVANAVQSGQTGKRVQMEGSDEAAQLGQRFDAMLEAQDVAEAKLQQLNLELEQRVADRTRELENTNKELESFSYSVSHDLRAPLRSIDGFSHLLLKKYSDLLDATGKDYLERVRRASQHMGQLIDDLLRLSKVTRGALKREQIDLGKIAEQVADGLQKSNPEREVRFDLQQNLHVFADAGLMRIVMENLLGNACKYTGKKPVAEIEFGTLDKNGESVYFVRDNGDGFNMEYAHKLFGAFQRLHSTSEFEGTGIGLATVQRIIHRHHGNVWAEAKQGVGATFYFTTPQRKRED